VKKFLLAAGIAVIAMTGPTAAFADKGGKGHGGSHKARGGDDNRGGKWRGHGGGGNRGAIHAVRSERDGARVWRSAANDQKKAWKRQAKAVKEQRKAEERLARGQWLAEREARRDWQRDQRSYRPAYREPVYRDVVYRDGRGGLGTVVGQVLPAALLGGYNVPLGYQGFYPDSPDYAYRYNDGNILRIERESNIVSGLIPLLGGGFGVGRMLPAGYDAYNVPLQYRDVYYDTPDAFYRYGDNAIYQVDPQTRMIESVVALLAGDSLGIGQQLPAGYDAYNLPLGYRDQYYDTDEYSYRYADGNIYQVDAQTQIIQAIISALV
jgi:hypothetical protein